MRLDIKKITSAINKIADLTSGDKMVPGVLLRPVMDEEAPTLKVCFNEGHKAVMEEIDAVFEDGDKLEEYVVSFEQLKRAIDNCQPSGIICVSEVKITYKENNMLTVSAEQSVGIRDREGNIEDYRKLAVKKMDLAWSEPSSSIKTSLLTRMDYESIFEPDEGVFCDEYNKAELMEALGKVSVERGRSIYISPKNQEIFVGNIAHATAVPVSELEFSVKQEAEIRQRLISSGVADVEASLKAEKGRIKQSVVIGQNVAKSVIGILNKCNSEVVRLHRRDKFAYIIAEEDNERVGIMFEMAQASKAQIAALDRYSSLGYDAYQLRFLREFLVNSVKSALSSSKSDNTTKIKFEESESGNTNLVIFSGNSGASISDVYTIECDECVSLTDDITTKEFTVSLQVLSDMLAQLKTECVAFDINIGPDGTVCIRISEIDMEKLDVEYNKGREETARLCMERGEQFDPAMTPTDVNVKMGYRLATLGTKQFTILKSVV